MRDIDFYNKYERILQSFDKKLKQILEQTEEERLKDCEIQAKSIIELLGYDISNPFEVKKKEITSATFTQDEENNEIAVDYEKNTYFIVYKDECPIFAICDYRGNPFDYCPLTKKFDREMNPFKFFKVRLIMYFEAETIRFIISKKNFEAYKATTNKWQITRIYGATDNKFEATIHLLSLLQKKYFEGNTTLNKLLIGFSKLNFTKALDIYKLCPSFLKSEEWTEDDVELSSIIEESYRKIVFSINYDDIFEL